MENAMFRITGIPNCLVQMDTITFRIATSQHPYVAQPLLKGVKLLVMFTALGHIEDELIRPANMSDTDMYKESTIGQALESKRYVEDLKWPARFKWRQEELAGHGGLETMAPILLTDRKIASKSINIMHPFCPGFHNHLNMQFLAGEKIIVNRTMRIGYCAAERFLGIMDSATYITRDECSVCERHNLDASVEYKP